MNRLESRLRILLIAEACNPTWSSVPLVGYNFALALASRPDLQVTVATHVRNRPALLGDPLAEKACIHYIDNEWLTGPLYQLSKALRGGNTLSWTTGTAMAWPGYITFEHAVNQRFTLELRTRAFDLIHRLTPLTPTIPSPLACWTSTPMIIGPLNGGLPWPEAYPELREQEREWLVPLRFLYRHLPFYRSSYRHLAGVIAGSLHTATEIPSCFRGARFYLPENGIDPRRFPPASQWTMPTSEFRFITVGRLVPYKGIDLTLDAMAGSSLLRRCRLQIIGDGPERQRLERLVRENNLDTQVTFSGWMSQEKLAGELRQSQAFVFPSLREFGGGVVLEAMAGGLPSIVVNHGGPAELISSECGVALPLLPRAEMIGALQRSMEDMVRFPEQTQAMGNAACKRVREEFTWEKKAGQLRQMYEQVVGR